MISAAKLSIPLAALLATASSGCSQQADEAPSFDVQVKVESDPGQPVKGALVLLGGKVVGKTDGKGASKLRLEGAEGESYAFNVECPERYESPKKPVVVTLRRIVGSAKVPRYTVTCPPTVRTVVVAVRAEKGPYLPVIYLGKEIAKTDASGAAHLLLQLPPNQPFRLSLDTSEFDKLRPQNPSASFEVKQRDEVFVFDQEFSLEKPRPVYRRSSRPRGPTPL